MDILVNGEVRELSIIDPATSCEWTQDLIGNAGYLTSYDDLTELYRMSGSDYTWWNDYIAEEQDLQDRLHELRQVLSDSEVENLNQAVSDCGDSCYAGMQLSLAEVVEYCEQLE
ncbi:MAG: hypothetical protein JKY96_02295 [Phycisphaerales bacterium]|nr:hypothetical protein [Phycisphaerales bacterium]